MSIYRRTRRLAGQILRRIPWLRRHLFASIGYRIISRDEAERQAASAWLGRLTARRQQKAYDDLLRRMYRGESRIDFKVAAEAVERTELPEPAILEVGCGNGYYAEVFDRLLDGPFAYLGVDCSEAMIETARRRYPQREFQVGDACALSFPDGSFDVVFNGVSLMHILDFERAIAESRRVSKGYCLFHSVPVFEDRDTTYLRKYAYGGLVVEVIFNRAGLLELFERQGLELVETWNSIPYDVHPVTPEHSHAETFLLAVPRPAGSADRRVRLDRRV